MEVGILVTRIRSEFDTGHIARLLRDRGYDTTAVVCLSDRADYDGAVARLKERCEAILILGDTDWFYDSLSARYIVERSRKILEIDGISYALAEQYEVSFIVDTVIPMLNSKCKTLYTTAVFKTFGKTESELRELLKDYIKNRNRIHFFFEPSLLECAVHIRYSSKMQKNTIDEVIAGVAEKLKDCTYALKDTTLAETTADLLTLRGKRLSVAESFTGGAISAALTKIPGASKYLYEDLVTYDSRAKIGRLGVEETIIDRYGAVSIETAYEMAANLLMSGNCDLVIATTGNAGPTSEKENEAGRCFIAVGDSGGIHIYEYNFTGDRAEVIESGVKTALYKLYRKLKENEFEELLKNQAASSTKIE